MGPDRWRQVSEIFEGALALTPEEREQYLAAKCGTDESLRNEVQSLISHHQKASDANFIATPATERAAPILVEGENETSANRLRDGQQIGPYQIKGLIGAGGMGEVYQASDTRLDRTVALKILPEDVASDQRRMLRFKQEARAVSALNQPNILTIYEFGEVEDLHFLAIEYVDGDTLRHKIVTEQLKLTEVIDIAMQVCAALEASHEAKIIHRDIKPENIMVRRRDGVVKVLDFGLAKLADKRSTAGKATDTEAATEVLLKTRPGSIMGTFNYMSPEQAQGLHVDERSDIWSVGIVIYEMVAGRTPFVGPTNSHTVVSILERAPELLAKSAKIAVPEELERIVRKALSKNVDERYQTAKDLLIDLKLLRKKLDQPRESSSDFQPQAFLATGVATTQRGQGSRAGGKFLLLIIVVVAVLVALGYAAYRWRSSLLQNGAATALPVQQQLNYWIEVQKYRDGKPFETPFTMAREINFEKDYQVRLNIRSSASGYLYVLNESPQPEEPLSILFPSPSTNSGSAFLPADTVTQIPENSWFSMDNQRGAEKVWLVWSQTLVPALEPLRGFANERDKGLVNNPDLSREALKFIHANAEPMPNAERDVELAETRVRTERPVIVHLILLEHH